MKALLLLEQAGVIDSLDRKLGDFLAGAKGAQFSENQELVALCVALTSRSLREGHVCLELWQWNEQTLFDAEARPVLRLPSFARLCAALRSADSVDSVDAVDAHSVAGVVEDPVGASDAAAKGKASGPVRLQRPLVLDRAGRLYFRRYFEHEQRLAAALVRLSRNASQVRADVSLDHYFPEADKEDRQRQAAELALQHSFLVVSGGPGTGKTATVVKILGLLAERALAQQRPLPRVLLLAPTGKAAARLKESIEQAKGRLTLSEEVAQAITDEASTIHRALGVHPESSTRFVRSVDNPLQADVVIVDEASMVDVALMRHLAEALPPGAQLILLGDRHQLASVEAGSVLGELCAALASKQHAEQAAWVELHKSYRFGSDSGIAAFASAVRQGQTEEARRLLQSSLKDLRYQPEWGPPQARKSLRPTIVEGFRDAMKATSVEHALEALGRFRVLCAHRKGPAGVDEVNELCRVWLVRAGLLPERGEFVRGRPILVTQNDYATGLYNGDVGLVWPNEEGQLRVFFEGPSGLRQFSPSQLPEHETAFAITIHKSQGSEYDHVLVVLPEETSALLSRELLYTAVTRARSTVVLSGSAASIAVACARSVERSSGLREALLERWQDDAELQK